VHNSSRRCLLEIDLWTQEGHTFLLASEYRKAMETISQTFCHVMHDDCIVEDRNCNVVIKSPTSAYLHNDKSHTIVVAKVYTNFDVLEIGKTHLWNAISLEVEKFLPSYNLQIFYPCLPM